MSEPPAPWVVETWKLIELRDFAKASGNIDAALERDPEDPEAHNVKGYLIETKSSHLQARKYYQRALDCNPKNQTLLAYVLHNLRRPKEALAVIEPYLLQNPDDDYGWDAKGMVQVQLGFHSSGIGYFAKALQINPNNPLASFHKLIVSRFMKEQFKIIHCWVCNAQFRGKGIEPIPYWDIPFDLCESCYRHHLSATKTRHVTYIEKLKHSSSSTKGILFAFSLGDKHAIVFEPSGKNAVPLIITRDILACQAVEKDPITGDFLTASESQADAGRYIQLVYIEDGEEHALIFELEKEYGLMLTFMNDIAQKLKPRPTGY